MSEKLLFSTKEAAVYLGKSASTVRHYVYHTKRLKPMLLGGSLVFTKSQLDRLMAEGPRLGGRKVVEEVDRE